MTDELKEAFAQSIADYLKTYHPSFDWCTPEEAAMAAVRVLTDDIGAAQNFLNVIGVDVDLYDRNVIMHKKGSNEQSIIDQFLGNFGFPNGDPFYRNPWLLFNRAVSVAAGMALLVSDNQNTLLRTYKIIRERPNGEWKSLNYDLGLLKTVPVGIVESEVNKLFKNMYEPVVEAFENYLWSAWPEPKTKFWYHRNEFITEEELREHYEMNWTPPKWEEDET